MSLSLSRRSLWSSVRAWLSPARRPYVTPRPKSRRMVPNVEQLEDRCVPTTLAFGLFNSGVTNTGALLPNLAVDPHYTLTTVPPASMLGPQSYVTDRTKSPIVAGPYLPDGPNSQWLSPQADQSTGSAAGNYVYHTTIDLTGYDPSTAIITGRWASDDVGSQIKLNGVLTAAPPSNSFSTFTPFTISTGFVAGINSLDFLVNNASALPNPTGFRVEMTATATPGADLVVTKSAAPNPVLAGSNLSYSITVANNGPAAALNVNLTDNLPVGTTFVSQTQTSGPAFTLGNTGNTITNTIASLGIGQSATFMVIVQIPTSVPGGTVFSNTATVRTTTFDPVSANNASTATVTVVGLPPPPPPPVVPTPIFATGADAGGGPQVNVYDAGTGALRASFFAYPAGFTGGVRVATAQNRDGSSILVTGAGPGGGPQVNVYDGQSLTPIISFYAFTSVGGQQSGTAGFGPTSGTLFSGGVFVAAGDINGDGVADIVVGADTGGGPQVQVIDGRTFNLISSFYAFSAGFTGGVRVAVGDVNGDGRADIIVGAGPGGGPQVNVYDGATLNLIASFYALSAGFTRGVYVAAGDTNGDRLAEIIVGAGAGGGPQVGVFNGSGALLSSFFAFAAGGGGGSAASGTAAVGNGGSSSSTFTGGVRVATVDPTGTGRARILAAAGPGGGPEVQEFDSSTIALLSSFFAYNPGFSGGVFVG